MSRTTDQARTILTDATVLATSIDAAMRTLADSRGGFPASTPGAAPATGGGPLPDISGPCREPGCEHTRPCTEHDTAVRLTATEAGAAGYDEASQATTRLLEHMRIAAHHVARAATLASRWGNPALDATAVAKRLQDIDQAVWCHNCAKHGHNNVRQDGRTECRECADFRRTWGVARTRTIIDRVTRGIPLRPDFIASTLTRDIGPGWTNKMPKPQKPAKAS